MKTKKLAILVAGVSALLLTGCTVTVTETYTEESVEMGNTSSGSIGETVKIGAESIELETSTLKLYVGENYKIATKVHPIQASDSAVLFTSSDDSVATVDANGNINAKKEGLVEINISVKDSTVATKLKVLCLNKITTNIPTAISQQAEAMKTVQDERFGDGLKKVNLSRYIDSVKTIYGSKSEYEQHPELGTVVYDYKAVETYVVDKELGFFSVGGYDSTIAKVDGTRLTEKFEWIFRTNDNYNTYIYHTGGNSKNYLMINTSVYIGQEKFNAIKDILNCVFRSGAQLAENPLSWALNADALGNYLNTQSSFIVSGGYFGTDYVQFTLEQKDYRYTEASVDETDDEIPAGTSVLQDYSASYTWHDGYMFEFTVDILERYSMSDLITGETNYVVEKRRILFDTKVGDDVVIEIPDNTEYTLVGDLYDL